jgi:hypothetical protein
MQMRKKISMQKKKRVVEGILIMKKAAHAKKKKKKKKKRKKGTNGIKDNQRMGRKASGVWVSLKETRKVRKQYKQMPRP